MTGGDLAVLESGSRLDLLRWIDRDGAAGIGGDRDDEILVRIRDGVHHAVTHLLGRRDRRGPGNTGHYMRALTHDHRDQQHCELAR